MNHDSKNIKKMCSMPTGDWNVVPLVLFDAAKNNCPTLTQNEKQLIHSLLLFSIDHQPHASRLSRLVVKKSVSQSLSQTTAFATIPKGRTVALDSDRFGLMLRHKSGISNATCQSSFHVYHSPKTQGPFRLAWDQVSAVEGVSHKEVPTASTKSQRSSASSIHLCFQRRYSMWSCCVVNLPILNRVVDTYPRTSSYVLARTGFVIVLWSPFGQLFTCIQRLLEYIRVRKPHWSVTLTPVKKSSRWTSWHPG